MAFPMDATGHRRYVAFRMAYRIRRSSSAAGLAWLVSLLVGCTADSPEGDSDPATTTTATSGVTGSDGPATSGESGAVDDESGTNDTADLEACQEPQPMPPAPVDCSGADGVITHDVYVEPQSGYPAEVLEGVRRVEGSININRTDLANLDFMACVEEVTGSVTIYGNDQLANVDGLWSLGALGADFVLSENAGLVDFDGLPNVVEIPGSLVVKNNAGMESLSGFQQLEGVGDLIIQSNPSLQSIDGLGGLRGVGGLFAVTNNHALCISSVNCVGLGITDPADPRSSWSARANDDGC